MMPRCGMSGGNRGDREGRARSHLPHAVQPYRPPGALKASPGRRRVRGFSLLEVLVAFSIMALALGALYQATGGSVRVATATDRATRAAITAESLIAAHPFVLPGGFAESGETVDGFRWELRATPYAHARELPRAWPLYRLQASVYWGEGARERSFTLVTLVPERLQ